MDARRRGLGGNSVSPEKLLYIPRQNSVKLPPFRDDVRLGITVEYRPSSANCMNEIETKHRVNRVNLSHSDDDLSKFERWKMNPRRNV